jgi:long-chain acyl-CoA synthetase
MPRKSLLEYFEAGSRPADEPALAWRRGYRMERWTRAQLLAAAHGFARELERRKIARAESVLIWGENSGEWVAAFLGCVFRGVLAVPMDAIASTEFARRVAHQVKARLVVASHNAPVLDPALPVLPFEGLAEAAQQEPIPLSASQFHHPEFRRNDPIEVVFTSGTTAEPRGVVLTHGNLLANLEPIEAEFQKYQRYERFFHPLHILNLLPLSHGFGQMLGIFIPQILGATAIFLDSVRPADVAQAIRRENINVLVTVPRLVESLHDKIERDLEAAGRLARFRKKFQAAEGKHFLRRWWIFRHIHRQFGWRFWAIVSGGAALPARTEEFWGRLGYAVIQGYGLTETTSLVSLNHPLRLGKGSIGKALPGLEVKLSDEGEILVRGENIAAGYARGGQLERVAGEDGWFHTGDLGELDAEGNLYFKGRKKNVIVTPEGMNIYPEDLEAALRKQPEVRDCVVVGLNRDGNAEPCAVLLLRNPVSNPAAVIERANQSLAGYQQIRRWHVWLDQDFPRTPTQKPLLPRIRETVESQIKLPAGGPASGPLEEWIARLTHQSAGKISPQARLATDLNLSSVDRVELLSFLEDRYQVDLDEASVAEATTVGELESLLRQPATREPAFPYARWPRRWPTTWIREAAYYLLVVPAALLLGWPRIRGRENLRNVRGPLLFVCNHVTAIDVGFVLPALPARLRRHLTVAIGGERLRRMRHPPADKNLFWRLYQQIQYVLVVSLLNVFPLPKSRGFRESFSFAGWLVDREWSILIFPEGALTPDGKVGPFRVGIGLLAKRLQLPVVPIQIGGLFELRETGKKMTRPGVVRVTIGTPVKFEPDAKPEEIARELEGQVISLGNATSTK